MKTLRFPQIFTLKEPTVKNGIPHEYRYLQAMESYKLTKLKDSLSLRKPLWLTREEREKLDVIKFILKERRKKGFKTY